MSPSKKHFNAYISMFLHYINGGPHIYILYIYSTVDVYRYNIYNPAMVEKNITTFSLFHGEPCDPVVRQPHQVRLVASCHARRHWKQKTVPSVFDNSAPWKTLKPAVGNLLERQWLRWWVISNIQIFAPRTLGKISTHFDEHYFLRWVQTNHQADASVAL